MMMMMITLGNEILLKLLQELQIQQIFRGQSFFSYNSLHGLYIFTDSVTGVLQVCTSVLVLHN